LKQNYIIIITAAKKINFAIIYLDSNKNVRVDGILETDFLSSLTQQCLSTPTFPKNILFIVC